MWLGTERTSEEERGPTSFCQEGKWKLTEPVREFSNEYSRLALGWSQEGRRVDHEKRESGLLVF